PISDTAKTVWEYELSNRSYADYPFKVYEKTDFNAPCASGSARFDTMIVAPYSMGTLARIATGVSNDLLTRAADVILKERRKLILVVRETPFSLIHLHDMKAVTEAGGIICPANASFYSEPTVVEDLAATVIDGLLELTGFEQAYFQWGY